jgi:hypothetical protein
VSRERRVVSASPNGHTDAEGRPVFDIVFQVEVPGHPPFSGAAGSGVPPERIPRLRAGETLPIKADPSVPQMMTVDWDRA